MLRRLRNNFQLSMICLMGVLAFIGVGPYAVYRALHGNWLVAGIDVLIVTCTCTSMVYAWRTGNTRRASLLTSVVISIGAVLVTLDIGVNGMFWIYALILVNFIMTGPWVALLVVGSSLLAITLIGKHLGGVFENDYQMTSFMVTCVLCSLFSFLFALQTRQQRKQLERMATLDPLTGAGNRRSLTQELNVVIAAHQRHGRQFGLLALDLDHFKQVNDTYGHAAGDQVLMDFVDLLQRGSRREDRIFRLGGEEFLMVFPSLDAHGLETVGAHLKEQLAEHLKSPGGPITVSMGGALLRTNETAEQWIRRADTMLYKAKASGRDRCLVDPS